MVDLDASYLAQTLHPLERKILPFIKKNSFTELSSISGIPESEISRPIQWLSEKGIVKLDESSVEIIDLGANGKTYLSIGLPESRFLKFLSSQKTLQEIKEHSGLSEEEVSVCIGNLRKKQAIEFKDGKISKLKDLHFPEQDFLSKLPIKAAELLPEEIQILVDLKKRKDIIKVEIKKSFSVEITSLGKALQKIKLDNIIDNLTPELLSSGAWKEKPFRRYDIQVPSKHIFAGRRHFVREATEYIKKIWLDMGFKEMQGSMIQTSFWNFDALFTAQYHPVREMQDTFFIKNPNTGKLPEKQFVDGVKDAHEHGANTGSKGWQYKWSEAEARKNVLRTHTTPLSAKTLASLKSSDLPAKFFSVGQAFRNETMDWSHLFEFTQSEGIVIDEDANMRNLLGYLKEFFKKMGYDKIRARPAYFPYTEPSVEIDVYHPVHKKWVELGGAGIFRPEVTVPLLGKDTPVLAWGLGPGRILTSYYNITDIRDLHKNDLKQLREIKAWMK